MSRRVPDREYLPPVDRIRLQFAKRGRLRFASHRDFQRAFERALRRAGVPMAYSAGFSPHPKISYANAAPTGAASEAEYLEIGVMDRIDPDRLADALDRCLPTGFDIVAAVRVGAGDFASRLEASVWQVVLPGVPAAVGADAAAALLAQESVTVQRMTKKGIRTFDIRPALVAARCASGDDGCAILTLVVRHGTPSVRPDDVLVGLTQVAALAPPAPPQVTRLAQGPLATDQLSVTDPFAPDRAAGVPIGADGHESDRQPA
jgi:radical SAM-linked protein